jgi:hypothetical protein
MSSPTIIVSTTSTSFGISPTQPLSIPFAQTFVALSPAVVFTIVVGLVFLVWALYTIVVTYHWVRYGHRSRVGIPAIIVHLVVSSALFLMAASGFV